MRLANKTALITGGGTGIGAGIARAFAREGARVALMGRRPEPLAEQEKAIRAAGGEALAVLGDVSLPRDAEGAVRAAVEAFGGLDILVNNAYYIVRKELAEQTLEEWNRAMAVNLGGLFLMCKHAAPHLWKNGGAVINIASTDGLKGAARCTDYAAVKGGMVNFTRALAVEWAGRGVRVNCICPGAVDTPGARAGVDSSARWESWEHLARAKARQYPLGRVGQPEDVAPAAVYFAGDESAWVTGQILAVDGGLMAGARYSADPSPGR